MIGRRQHGQAMSEFLTSALHVLVPLFIAITALGKLLDVQRTADMAARYQMRPAGPFAVRVTPAEKKRSRARVSSSSGDPAGFARPDSTSAAGTPVVPRSVGRGCVGSPG